MSDKSEQTEKKKVGGGNSISPPTQSKRWCFTLNNPKKGWLDQIEQEFKRLNLSYIIGSEVGEKGTPHLQGYIESKKKMRPSQIKWDFGKWNQAHWEKAKGSSIDNAKYCSKDGQFVMQGLKMPKVEKKRWLNISLYPWQEKVLKELKKEPDDRTINWIWEPDGNMGKTTFQKYIFSKLDYVSVTGGKASDMKNGIIEYIKLHDTTPSIVLINIPRVYQDFVSFQGIEEIKDMFFYSGKYEGGMVCGDPPHVVVFANHYPDTSKMSADRWQINKIINFNCHGTNYTFDDTILSSSDEGEPNDELGT